MRAIVKVRKIAGCVVVTLPVAVLQATGLEEGDRALIESASSHRIVITKEKD